MSDHHNSTTSASSSIDPQERERFDRLAEMWWDDKGPMWPLHRLNQFRTGIIVNAIHRHLGTDSDLAIPFTDLKLLDIGCGGGILSETMARYGAQVHGVDISEKNIAIARQHAAASALNIQYDMTTAEALAESGERYDIVLNMEVVEHVADLPLFMRACNTLVKGGGVQFVSTINRNPISGCVAIFGAEYVLRWLPKGTHQYAKLVKPKELEALLNEGNLQVVERTGVAVNPFNRSMSATASERVSYMLFAKKTG